MTVPDSLPLVDVIAEAVEDAIDDYGPTMNTHHLAQHVTAAVVARCQRLTVEHKAELVGGMTERGTFSRVVDNVPVATRVRVVGPWQDPS